MNKIFRLILFLIAFCSIASCQKENVIESPNAILPKWISVVNETFGEVLVTEIASNNSEKKNYKFIIRPKNKNINWEVYYNDQIIKPIQGEKNWQGVLKSVDTSSETVRIIFVDGAIVKHLGNTNITYRYDLSWKGAFSKEQIHQSYVSAVQNFIKSNAEELTNVLKTIKKELFNDSNDFAHGYAYGDSLIKMNINEIASVNYYSTVWIHETAHIFEALHPKIQTEVKSLYSKSKGKWLYPDGYYNKNEKEMWACAVTAYVLGNPSSGGAHFFIHKEAYYQNKILPYLKKQFEN